MSPRLLLQVEGAGGAPVELPRSGVLSIGSGERADLCVEGPGVADVHCVIGRVKGGGWALKDLGSAQGTLVNGQPVQQTRLEAGDEIAVGTRRLAVIDPAAAAPAQPPEAVPTLKGYRIEKRLGRGGMGTVFLALQESLDRRVALKVLSPRLSADLDFVRRFQAEARAAAALSHPNVVTVHDVWEEGGHHWLAMEYMEHGNLEERVAREGRLAPGEVLAVLIDAARGLVFAELRGIVHRDIKPANLMRDGLGHTKIADLGLATHLEAEATQSGDTRVFGTPHFISPEQTRGEAVDGRSDLYSLGATAYRLLSGRTPFEGATTRDLLRSHLTEPARPLRELVRDVPPALEAVVLRLLEKDPGDRFQSAAELLAELEHQRAGLITAAGAAPAGRGLWWLAGAAVLAALVAGYYLSGHEPAVPDPVGAGQVVAAAPAAGSAAESDAAIPPRSTSVGAAAGAPLDDDSALKALERQAVSAYEDLPSELTPQERGARLAELRDAYPGTTAAQRWSQEIEALEVGTRSALEEREREAAATGAALERIREAGRVDQPLHALLAALRSLPQPAAAATDPGFGAARVQALRTVLARRVAGAEEALAEVEALAARGDFEPLDSRLASLAAWLDPFAPPAAGQPGSGAATVPDEFGALAVGPPEPGAGPPAPDPGAGLPPLSELEQLVALHAAALARRAGLPAERAAWEIGREHADARALAQAFAAGGALGGPLARLELTTVEAGLAQLAERFGDTATAAFARALRAELGRARMALAALVQAFRAGEWRRRSILDPRGAGRAKLTVVGADAGGLLVEERDDLARVDWAAFGADTGALDQLFRQRLERDYTLAEQRGIAALMRLAAVQRAVSEAREMLDDAPAILTEGELGSLLAGFEQARPWCTSSEDLDSLESERAAARLLASALAAAGRGAWSSAVADAERLLAEHRDTLLVRLVSDGRPWLALPPPEADPTLPARPPLEPADGPAQTGELGEDAGRDGRADGPGE